MNVPTARADTYTPYRTTRYNIKTLGRFFSPQILFKCLYEYQNKGTFISPNSIDRLVFVTKTQNVFCDLGV